MSAVDVCDPLNEDGEDSDGTSSTDNQDHEQTNSPKFGLDPGRIYVIPNAIVADKFKPFPRNQTDKGMGVNNRRRGSILTQSVTIVVLSRLAYRKGVDLLVATAPRICAKFPHVHFVIGA